MDGCGLRDVEKRRELAKLSSDDLRKSDDAMIQLALALEPDTLALRKRYEVEVEEPERQAYAQIARAEFALDTEAHAPDATFTLRLAYGKVSGYMEGSEKVPFFTTLRGMFASAEEAHNHDPNQLPANWLAAKSKLNLDLPFNFVSTADTIGGNSGSPVVNRKGDLVGINFDRNRYGLVRNFIYSEKQARHVAVYAPAVIEVLKNVYHCSALVQELQTGRR